MRYDDFVGLLTPSSLARYIQETQEGTIVIAKRPNGLSKFPTSILVLPLGQLLDTIFCQIEFVSQKLLRSGRLGKKKCINNCKIPCSSQSTKGLGSEQRAGWDWKANADISSLQLWTRGLRAAAKVICLHIFGQEMQFNPSSDWSLYKINGNVSNMGLCSDSTKSKSNFTPGLLLSKVSWFLIFKKLKTLL